MKANSSSLSSELTKKLDDVHGKNGSLSMENQESNANKHNGSVSSLDEMNSNSNLSSPDHSGKSMKNSEEGFNDRSGNQNANVSSTNLDIQDGQLSRGSKSDTLNILSNTSENWESGKDLNENAPKHNANNFSSSFSDGQDLSKKSKEIGEETLTNSIETNVNTIKGENQSGDKNDKIGQESSDSSNNNEESSRFSVSNNERKDSNGHLLDGKAQSVNNFLYKMFGGSSFFENSPNVNLSKFLEFPSSEIESWKTFSSSDIENVLEKANQAMNNGKSLHFDGQDQQIWTILEPQIKKKITNIQNSFKEENPDVFKNTKALQFKTDSVMNGFNNLNESESGNTGFVINEESVHTLGNNTDISDMEAKHPGMNWKTSSFYENSETDANNFKFPNSSGKSNKGFSNTLTESNFEQTGKEDIMSRKNKHAGNELLSKDSGKNNNEGFSNSLTESTFEHTDKHDQNDNNTSGNNSELIIHDNMNVINKQTGNELVGYESDAVDVGKRLGNTNNSNLEENADNLQNKNQTEDGKTNKNAMATNTNRNTNLEENQENLHHKNLTELKDDKYMNDMKNTQSKGKEGYYTEIEDSNKTNSNMLKINDTNHDKTKNNLQFGNLTEVEDIKSKDDIKNTDTKKLNEHDTLNHGNLTGKENNTSKSDTKNNGNKNLEDKEDNINKDILTDIDDNNKEKKAINSFSHDSNTSEVNKLKEENASKSMNDVSTSSTTVVRKSLSKDKNESDVGKDKISDNIDNNSETSLQYTKSNVEEIDKSSSSPQSESKLTSKMQSVTDAFDVSKKISSMSNNTGPEKTENNATKLQENEKMSNSNNKDKNLTKQKNDNTDASHQKDAEENISKSEHSFVTQSTSNKTSETRQLNKKPYSSGNNSSEVPKDNNESKVITTESYETKVKKTTIQMSNKPSTNRDDNYNSF